MTGAGARGGALAAGCLAAAAGCVAIETAPGGVQSVRLDVAPPSVVVGDSLRDSTGAVTALRAVAFGEDGGPLETARVRYVFVPATDTVAGAPRDTSLVVDSVSGVVRATLPPGRPQGRVAAVVGDRFQLVQTFELVLPPVAVTLGDTPVPELRYDCTDLRPGVFAPPTPDTGASATRFAYNAVPLPVLTVQANDTSVSGRLAGVRSRLVRWDVDSGPFPSGRPPRVARTAGGRDSVDAVAVIAAVTADRARPVDTTSTDGTSRVVLRIRPTALGNSTVAERDFTVRVRGRAQPGRTALANNPVYVRVRLRRNPTPPGQEPPSCQ